MGAIESAEAALAQVGVDLQTVVGLPSYARPRPGPFNALRSAYNWTPSTTQALRAALARAETERVRVGIIGHSGAGGGGADKPGLQDYGALLRRHIAGIGGPLSGPGFALCDSNLGERDNRMTFTGGTWGASGNDFQPFVFITDADAVITMDLDQPCSTVQFGTADSTAAIGLYCDGQLLETYTGPNVGSTATAVVLREHNVTYGKHRLEIRCTTAANPSIAYGMGGRNATGLEVSNWGRGGAEILDWTDNTFSSLYQVMEVLGDPHVALVQVGANEALAALAVGTMKGQYEDLLDKLQSDGIVPVLLTESQPNPSGGSPISQSLWNTYLDAYYDLADDYSLPLIDLSHHTVSFSTMDTLGMVAADDVHLNEYGYAYCGQVINQNLFPATIGPETPHVHINQDATLRAALDQVAEYSIMDDGSSTASWPERLVFWYKHQGESIRRTAYFNEYGELRISPARASTVPMRLFTRETTSDPAHNSGVPIFEVRDDRTNNNTLFTIKNNGSITTPTETVAATGTSRTTLLTDQNCLVTRSNSSASTETIPLNSGTALPVGFTYRLQNIGTGVLTISPTGGVTLTSKRGLKLRQYEEAILVKTATDTWRADVRRSMSVAWPTGSEPTFSDEPDGVLWVEYTP